jgi:DNA repair exonuclease SbcCD ATPase subunit
MIIEKIVLNNFCQHRDRKEVLGSGMIGIVGKNGNGKTNFVRSLLFALSGDAGGAGKKEDDVTKGTSSGYVEIFFTIGDKNGYVKRYMNNSRTTLKFGDEEFKSAKDADAAIYGILGISSKLLREVVFVGQGCIENMLFERPADRAKAFSALFGTDSMERIRDLLQRELITVQAVSRADEIVVARQDADTIEKSIIQLRAQLNTLSPSVLSAQEFEAVQATIKARDNFVRATTNLEILKVKQADKKFQYSNECEKLKKLTTDMATLKASVDEFRPHAEAAKERLKNAEAAQRVEARRSALVGMISQYQQRLALPLPSGWTSVEDGQLNAAKEAVDSLRGPVTLASKVVTALSSLGAGEVTCPTCRQPVPRTFIDEQIRVVKEDGEKLKAATAFYSNSLSARTAFEKKVSEDSSAREVAHARLELAQRELVGLGEQLMPVPVDTDRELVSEFEALSLSYRSREMEVASLEGHIRALKNEVDALDTTFSSMELPAVVSSEAAEEANVRLKRHAEANLSIAGVNGQVQTLESNLTLTKNRIAKMEEDEGKMVKRLSYRKLCEDARMVLHHDRLPNRVAQVYLASINTKMNEYLEVFQARYSCSIQPDLSVKCHFGEHELVAERLSGGQRIELGLAFRFALYDLFVGHLGLLVIDEPTAWLDDDHIEAVVRVLERVKVHSRSKGMQVIVPTHEARLMSAFDRVIQI